MYIKTYILIQEDTERIKGGWILAKVEERSSTDTKIQILILKLLSYLQANLFLENL